MATRGNSAAAGRAARSGHHWIVATPALAGILYSISWAVGLAIFSSSADVHSSGADLVSTYAGHRGVATAQYVLTEGVPAIALLVVVWALARAAGGHRPSQALLACGLAAAAISIVQCVLGLYLAGRLIPGRRTGPAVTVFDAINRLDGVKMLLLATVALAAFALLRAGHPPLPRWLAYESLALAVAIAISGVGYLLLLSGPALAAWVSLPLLLVWVTGVGVALARAEGSQAGTR
jgi:hypothetical protein